MAFLLTLPTESPSRVTACLAMGIIEQQYSTPQTTENLLIFVLKARMNKHLLLNFMYPERLLTSKGSHKVGHIHCGVVIMFINFGNRGKSTHTYC